MFGKKQRKERENAEFLKELAEQRETTRSLVDRYEAEVKTARSAVLAVGKAREERDEYRRVLAAAIATERRREAQVEALEQEQQRLEAIATRELRAAAEEGARRKELSARLESLEGRLSEELSARERAIGDVTDRAWAEREAARNELVRVVVGHREEVTSALRETAAQIALLRAGLKEAVSSHDLPSESPQPTASPDPAVSFHGPSVASAATLRARVLIGFSIASTLVVVALIPLAVLSVSDPERALFVHLASGLGPWHLILSVVILAGVAVGLLSWAIRDLEAVRADRVDLAGKGLTPAEETVPLEEKELTPPTAAKARDAAATQPNPNAGRNGTPRA